MDIILLLIAEWRVSPTGQQQSGVSPTGQQQSGVFLTGQQQSEFEFLQEKLLHDHLLAHIIKVAVARAYEQFYKALDCLENKMVSDEEREDDEDAAQIDCEFIHSQS